MSRISGSSCNLSCPRESCLGFIVMFAAKGDPTKSLKYATCSLKSNNDGRFRGRLRFENDSARSLQPKMIKKNDIEMFMLLFAAFKEKLKKKKKR